MGISLCRRHGESGIVSSISIDICEEIMGRSKEKIENVYVVTIKVFDEDEHVFDQSNYISENLFKTHNLKLEYEIHSESDEEKINSFFPKTSGVCGKCFDEYMSSRKIISNQA